MNFVDIATLVVVGFLAVTGLNRGFLLGMIDLLALCLAIVVGARVSDWIADPLRDRGFSDVMASASGLFVGTVVAYAAIGLAVRILVSPLGALGAGTPLAWVNSVLGLIPGAIKGLVVAAVLIIILEAMPVELGIRAQILASPFAETLTTVGKQSIASGLLWAGVDPASIGIPAELLR